MMEGKKRGKAMGKDRVNVSGEDGPAGSATTSTAISAVRGRLVVSVEEGWRGRENRS